jgi:hypothetical protein
MTLHIYSGTLFNTRPQDVFGAIVAIGDCDPNLSIQNTLWDGSDYWTVKYDSGNVYTPYAAAERATLWDLISSPTRIEIRGVTQDWQGIGMSAPISSFSGAYANLDDGVYDIRVDTTDCGGKHYCFPHWNLQGTVYGYLATRLYNALLFVDLGQDNVYDLDQEAARISLENSFRGQDS